MGAGNVLFHLGTYLQPGAWYRFDAAKGESTRTALLQVAPFNFDDAEVVREFAVSKDGTRVPLNIIRRKGTKLDGNNPTCFMVTAATGSTNRRILPGRRHASGSTRAAFT